MSNLVSRVVVPRNGVAHLCATQDGQLEVLAEAPGDPDARHVLSEDGSFLAVMDRENTRAGLFELLPTAPWLREVLPISPLPSGCVGHAALAMHDRLLIGGKGRTTKRSGSGHRRQVQTGWPCRFRRTS